MRLPIEKLEAFPPLSNPFHHDLLNMGEIRGMDLYLMYGNSAQEQCKFLILVEKSTGRRVQINIPEIFKDAPEYQAKENNKKLYQYHRGCVKLTFLYGQEQTAMAVAEGFIWKGSTDTHDVFKNAQFRTVRYINKTTKNFYEVQE